MSTYFSNHLQHDIERALKGGSSEEDLLDDFKAELKRAKKDQIRGVLEELEEEVSRLKELFDRQQGSEADFNDVLDDLKYPL